MSPPASPVRLLIVADSHIVRAKLIMRIRDRYDFREEMDGEAGWQSLVLDPSVQLVIIDLSSPALDGLGLLTRIRASRLARISQIPVLLIAGDEEAVREQATALGASDFLGHNAGNAELLTRIDSLVRLARAQQALAENRKQQAVDTDSGLFTRKYLELQAAQALSHAARHGTDVSILVIGFDGFGAFRDEHGVDAAAQLQLRFSRTLASRVRKEDSLGHFAGAQFAIISPGTTCSGAEVFAQRLRLAVEEATVVLHGRPISLTVSIGIANTPADTVTSAGALLELAGSRAQAAQRAGGNLVLSCSVKPVAVPTLHQALDLIKQGDEGRVTPHLATLGQRLLPLLGLLESELGVNLQLAQLEKTLAEALKKSGEKPIPDPSDAE